MCLRHIYSDYVVVDICCSSPSLSRSQFCSLHVCGVCLCFQFNADGGNWHLESTFCFRSRSRSATIVLKFPVETKARSIICCGCKCVLSSPFSNLSVSSRFFASLHSQLIYHVRTINCYCCHLFCFVFSLLLSIWIALVHIISSHVSLFLW